MTFFGDALLVAGKDLRIERRSRVALQQILPFGTLTLVDIGIGREHNVLEIPGNHEAEKQSPGCARGRLDHVGVRAKSCDDFIDDSRRLRRRVEADRCDTSCV